MNSIQRVGPRNGKGLLTKQSIETLGRVMLIDDDLVDRMACQRLLNRLHLADELLCLPDGEAAFHHMESDANFDADVIFLDINMPRMTGLEFLQAVDESKKIQFSGSVAVMVSIDLTPRMQAKFEQIPQVKAFIRKPMKTEELVAIATTIAAAK